MRPIRGGTFRMGSDDGYIDEQPAHEVTVPDFHLCAYQVTQAQWRAVMGSDPPDLKFKGCDDCPVEGVTWSEVQAFLQKLNQLTGRQYRLPTEAEWEYAARGGASAKGKKFAGSDDPDEVAWYRNISDMKTHPVGGKKANELGLFDMNGNVEEWCQDTWHDEYQGAPADGSAWISDGEEGIRVTRGGSWCSSISYCRTTNRFLTYTDTRYSDVGFRLAR